jgi:phosphoglycerate dehydrogenase-like enzyme
VPGGGNLAAQDSEPLPENHPSTRLSNIVLTLHFGYRVIEVYRAYSRRGAENALAFLDGKPIRVMKP